MFKSFYIKPHERGMLFYRSKFEMFLLPGTHRRMGWHWQVKTFDLNQPQVQIDHLELLLQTHAHSMDEYFMVVRTAYNQAALVRLGQEWCTIGPNQLQAFWRGFIEVEVHLFNLDEGLELPSQFVQRLRDVSLPDLNRVSIPESQLGMLYEQDNFVRPLAPGEYGFWTCDRKVSITRYNRTRPEPDFSFEEILIEQHPDFVASYCESVQLGNQEVAIVRHQGKVITILPPCSRKLFWQGVAVEVIDISEDAKLSPALVAELVAGLPEVLELAYEVLHILEVPAQHLGMLYEASAFVDTLTPDWHVWWTFGRAWKTEVVDLRLQTLEVSGQEILSKDKVSLRLNLTAGYRITDPVQAKTGLSNIEDYLYKELQFALRSAVGTKSLDQLLEDKGAIDASVSDYIREKTEQYGVVIASVGVKDIILPGEMKAILCQVVEAEKSAQANVIRRREETAATRSMLNTAKVMESNPVALRLKELEVLERIADKIEHIHVNGGLDSILTEMIRINGARE